MFPEPSAAAPTEEYDGPIRYFQLSQTLRPFTRMPPSQTAVLFAFAGPGAASHVVTAACAMAAQKRTVVHIASMGRETVDLDTVLKVNGILADDCPVYMHDAQIDFALQSSQYRLQKGVEGALGHLHRMLWLQAVFFDDSRREHDYLRSGVLKAASTIGVTSIPVPAQDAWMLSLDAHSLREWHQLQINIVIQAQPETAGSLLRLLRSIQNADYGGLSRPRVIVELPARTDVAVLRHLSTFAWPPKSRPGESKLFIRRRISDQPLTPALAALQAMESYFPATASSHVLVLAPEVELNSKFYQLLVLLILEYRHSARAMLFPTMMGISLLAAEHTDTDTAIIKFRQHLDGRADLFFGDKYGELQEFLSMRLAADSSLSKAIDSSANTGKVDTLWTRPAIEWMRSQGFCMLQTAPVNGSSPLAIIHQDLPPFHEQVADAEAQAEIGLDLTSQGDVLLAQTRSANPDRERQLSRASVASFLGPDMWLAGADNILMYDYDDRPIRRSEIIAQTKAYGRRFASAIGGCSDAAASNYQPGNIQSLFC